MDKAEMVHGIIDLPQRDVVLMLEAGYLYMELGKHKEAEDVFQGVAALLPKSEVPHMALGNMFFSMGRFGQALKCHTHATELNKNSGAAYAGIAESLFFLKRHDEAVAALDKAEKVEPEGPASAFARSLREAHGLGIFK